MFLRLSILSLFLVNYCFCTRTLVLLDSYAVKETHSIFFQTLKDRGHTVSLKLADDPSLSLFKYGELLYDNLIVFSPNVEEFGGDVDVANIADFIDEGGNMLVATNEKPSNLLRELATQCGIEMDVSNNVVIDHFNYVLDSLDHTKIALDSDRFIDSELITGSKNKPPVVYEGGGLLVNETNPLVVPIATAYSTSYCHNPLKPIEQAPVLIGSNTVLVAALQTWNNQRAVFSGSLEMFSNNAFLSDVSKFGDKVYEKSGNQEFAEALTKWAFKETGVIRVKSISYGKQGEPEQPSGYTVMDTAIYTMEIEEKKGDEWVPFNTDDLQLEFVRIDPFIRTFVPRVSDGKYQVVFKVPDVYGVFKFKVDYMRVGYTNIFNTTQVPVRPLRHTQYERFIVSAYPYYASAFSMMAGLFMFALIILHTKTEAKEKKA